MVRIGRSFDELDKKIKQFNQDIKTADTEVKQLDKSLKLNPGNVDAVRQKFSLLQKSLQTNADKLNALKQKQAALNIDLKNGAISQDTYNKQLAKTQKQINATEKEINELTVALQRTNAALREANYEKLTNGLDKAQKKAEAFSKAALGVAGALTAIIVASVKANDELADNATHYGTSVENLQIWQNRLGKLAKDQEAYTESLQKIGAIQSSITAGRGARYLTYLKQLGLTQEDVLGKSNGEVFDMIYAKLRNVTDATERATIAQGLLGDTGLEIAVIAGTVQGEIDNLDNTLIENGIITTEQAKAADETANKWLELKQQYQANSAELMVSAMPAIEAVTNLLKTAVIPTVGSIAKWLGSLTSGQQKMLMVILLIIIVLPKVIALGKGIVGVIKLFTVATHAQTAATAGLNAVAGPWLLLIIAITAAVILLVYWISKLTGAETNAIDSSMAMLDSLDDIDTKMSSMGSDLELGGDVSYQTSNHKTYDFNLDVTATGDTPISQENADYIAENLENKMRMDFINNELGGVVR